MTGEFKSGSHPRKSSGAKKYDRELEAKLKALRATLRGKKSGKIPTEEDSPARQKQLFPLSVARKEARAAEDKKLAQVGIGGLYPGKGIYLGVWRLENQNKNLSRTFNLFASPEDLPLVVNFNDAVKDVAALENWHGYDGFNHDRVIKSPEESLLEALASGSYKGEWFIPPLPILTNYLYKNREEGLLKTSLKLAGNEKSHGQWYWSCSPSNQVSHFISNQSFSCGDITGDNMHGFKVSVRPVRAELRF